MGAGGGVAKHVLCGIISWLLSKWCLYFAIFDVYHYLQKSPQLQGGRGYLSGLYVSFEIAFLNRET